MAQHKRTKRKERSAATSAAASSAIEASADVEIERILPGGLGLAHADGRTILVALAAPGDRVRVRIREVRGRVAFASIDEIYAASPVRVTPSCPYFGRCGGCDFQQLNYEAQLAAKVEIVRDCLRRIARTEPPAHIPIIAAPARWAYRSRAEWQYDANQKQLGYFERGSHRICDTAVCPVAAPQVQETLIRLRAQMHTEALPEGTSEFQAAAGDNEVSLAPAPPGFANAADIRSEVVRTVGGFRYRFDSRCFFQINHQMLGLLIDEAVKDVQGEAALDLYCGVGLFTLPLASRFAHVTGIEANAQAVAYARRNLTDAGLLNARVEASQVGEWLRQHIHADASIDFVLLDPPRTGVEDKVIDGLLTLRPRRITYVSCDPATLARDLRHLITGGYQLDSVTALDLFPQTHHVETIAHLTVGI